MVKPKPDLKNSLESWQSQHRSVDSTRLSVAAESCPVFCCFVRARRWVSARGCPWWLPLVTHVLSGRSPPGRALSLVLSIAPQGIERSLGVGLCVISRPLSVGNLPAAPSGAALSCSCAISFLSSGVGIVLMGLNTPLKPQRSLRARIGWPTS